ncbi:extracellular solute-binding protein [Janibacter sp. CX7]|uniref:ABC transporter substrate-binding protein n=1 Tax=Janibacter sp. CX7 TaxID=2963431 RepID=UPI0020CD43C1|nr:extracellular solute-binding protein [Janibacter sp. CX7]UTT66527.1 extracellular solute-binding protein [Janibacter sp. CX7]
MTPLTRNALALTITLGLAATAACAPPQAADTEPLPDDQSALVERAKEEGEVRLGAGGHTKPQADLLAKEFKKKYGIEVKYVRENSGQIAQKVEAQGEGNRPFDVVSLNDGGTMKQWADDGLLEEAPVDNLDDVLPPLQSDAAYVPFTWYALGFAYNSSRTEAADVPKTWEELSKAQGKKAVADPSASGAALTFATGMQEIEPDFVPTVGKDKSLVTDSALALSQLLTTGEATWGIPGIESDVATARAAGEPLAMAYPEGKIGSMPSFAAPLKGVANPAAARLLIQFMLSDDFQAQQVGIGSRSVLADQEVPEGGQEIDAKDMLVLTPESLEESKEEVTTGFDEAFGR